MEYPLNCLDDPVLMAVPIALLTDFSFHLESSGGKIEIGKARHLELSR